MTTFVLYLLLCVLPNLGKGCLIISIFLAMGAIFVLLGGIIMEEEGHLYMRLLKKIIIWFLITSGLAICCPSRKDMAILYTSNHLTQNEQIAKLPPKIVNVLNKYLDEILESKND